MALDFDTDAYLDELDGGITNEEYILSCNHEKLTEEIVNIALNAYYLHSRIAKIPRCEDGAVMKKDIFKTVSDWLKEKHKS